MANDTVIPIPPAKYGINEVVYLRESAADGFIEAMKISGVRYNPNVGQNMYLFTFRKGKQRYQTVGDANDQRHAHTIMIVESELLTKVEALTISIAYLQNLVIQQQYLLNSLTPQPTSEPSNPSGEVTFIPPALLQDNGSNIYILMR